MKNLLIAALILSSSFTANAGSVTYVPPAASAIEEPAMMGNSGNWIIPFIIVAVITMTLLNKNCKAPSSKMSAYIARCY